MTVFNTYGFYNQMWNYMCTMERAFQTYRLTGQVGSTIKDKLAAGESFRTFINTIYCYKPLYLSWTYTECCRCTPDKERLEQFNNFIDELYSVVEGLQ